MDSTCQHEEPCMFQGGKGLTVVVVGAYLPNTLPSGSSDMHIMESKHLTYVEHLEK